MRFPSHARALAGVSALAWLALLPGCSPPAEQPTSAAAAIVAAQPASEAGGQNTGPDPLAAAKAPYATESGAQAAAMKDRDDNRRATALALELQSHPLWLSRQQIICGPANGNLLARYATLQGPPSDELRDLKVACIAKDIAERAGDRGKPGSGVENTKSL